MDPAPAIDTLSQTILGSLIVVLVFACLWLANKLAASQEARVNDAKKVVEDALKREEKWQNVLVELTSAVERLSLPPGRPR